MPLEECSRQVGRRYRSPGQVQRCAHADSKQFEPHPDRQCVLRLQARRVARRFGAILYAEAVQRQASYSRPRSGRRSSKAEDRPTC